MTNEHYARLRFFLATLFKFDVNTQSRAMWQDGSELTGVLEHVGATSQYRG